MVAQECTSLVPRPFPPPVFDRILYAKTKTGGGNGLGTRLGVHFDVASAAGPPMFRIVSALCPHYSRSLSAPFPQHLRNLSALFPRYFRIVTTP